MPKSRSKSKWIKCLMSKEGQIKNQGSRVIYDCGFLESRLISWDLRYYSLSNKIDWLALRIGTNCWVIPGEPSIRPFFYQLSIEWNTSSSNWQQIFNSHQFILNKIKSSRVKSNQTNTNNKHYYTKSDNFFNYL